MPILLFGILVAIKNLLDIQDQVKEHPPEHFEPKEIVGPKFEKLNKSGSQILFAPKTNLTIDIIQRLSSLGTF